MLKCQAVTAPCHRMSPGPGHPQGSLHNPLFQLFSVCHPPDLTRSQRSPPHTNPTPAGILGWLPAFSCRKPQTKGLSCTSVGLWAGGGGGGGAEIGHRAGPVGPVGPAGPCPWHPDTPRSPLSLSLPLPGGSSASAQLPLINHRPTEGHPGCGGPVPPPVPGPAAPSPGSTCSAPSLALSQLIPGGWEGFE